MIKFFCSKCDKKIGVPDEYAGKKIRCPRCKQPVRVPEIEIEPVEEPTPETVWPDDLIPKTTPPEDAGPTYDVSSDQEAQIPAPKKPAAPRCSKCLTVIPHGSEFCITCGHPAPVPKTADESEKPKKTRIFSSVPMGKGFVTDLFSMISPVKSGTDMIVFFILFLFHTLVNIPFFIPLYVKIVTLGVICTYLFDVLLETANGNNNLPMFEMPENFFEVIKPFFQFIVSGFYAFFPLFIWFSLVAMSASNEFENYEGLDNDTTSDIPAFLKELESTTPPEEPNEPEIQKDPFGTDDAPYDPFEGENPFLSASFLVPVGIFFACMLFWPMVVLNIVLGNVFFPNPVKVIQNIGRTLKPYLICCGIMYLTSALIWLSIFEFTLEGLFEGSSFIVILGIISILVGTLCIAIYAMRVLGLLYRHYEDRLDW
jgi:hypothetical protein